MVPNPGSLHTTGKPEVSPYLRHDLYEGQREIFVYISLAKSNISPLQGASILHNRR
jgi:hypothetical protein